MPKNKIALKKIFLLPLKKEEIVSFFRLLTRNNVGKIELILLIFIFLLIPTQNHYAQMKVQAGFPPFRELDISFETPPPYPVNINQKPPPFVSASSAIVVDVPSKAIIFSKNPDWRLPPASTTKIMTALIVLDYWKIDDVLTVVQPYYWGQIMKLRLNERIRVENLLYGLLVHSANDAAYTLAINYPGGMEGFVEAMNKKASQLNLLDTHFTNPIGIDEENHYTSVHDLAVLASEAIKNPDFARIVATPAITVLDESGQIEHQLVNINQLLGKVSGLRGIKTGWTEKAGECLVSYVKRPEGEIIAVILGSNDRFGETKKLIDWVFENFSWQPIEAIAE